MSEDEKQLVKKFKNLYIKDFNNEHITSNDRLSYIECALLTELIEKLEKELQQEKEKNKEVITYIKEKQKIQYKYALSQIECDEILKLLEEN